MHKKVIELTSYIMTALSNCTLYSVDHPAVIYHAGKAVRIMDDLYADKTLSFTILGDSLIVNDTSLAGRSIHVNSFIKRLRRKGIEKIVITEGITVEELKEFISEIAFSDRISGAYPHISSGIIQVRLSAEGDDANVQTVMDENITKTKEIYQKLSKSKELDMTGLEDVVMSFIEILKKGANVISLISPVKSYSEYTYAHTTNVAVLSIFQTESLAESLDLKGEILYDIGIAGLLHDVGKVFISKEIVEKQARLDKAEWTEMKKHPEYGAMYLSTLSNLSGLAVIAAFEHHMRFNGTGYPETKRRGKKQHIISQIIAISDFFDALRTERPYRQALSLPVIIRLLKEGSGKDFNPLLVDNFILTLEKVRAF